MHYFGLGFLLLFLSSGVHGINPFHSRNQGQLQQLKIVADRKLASPHTIEIRLSMQTFSSHANFFYDPPFYFLQNINTVTTTFQMQHQQYRERRRPRKILILQKMQKTMQICNL
jgi:hypothetical protein